LIFILSFFDFIWLSFYQNMRHFFLCIFAALSIQQGISQTIEPCISHEMMLEQLKTNPEFAANMAKLEQETKAFEYQTEYNPKSKSATKIIPVVFHVIHQYGSENISRAQCLDQLRVLNEDFRRKNADTTNTPAPFKPLGADVSIEFRIAKKDPNGNCTDGVNRVYSPLTFSARDNVKSLIYWPSNKYLNVWVVGYITSSSSTGTGYVVGFAQFPGGSASTDGIVVRHDFLGNIGTASGERGRTSTHEVGHWLNLRHIWGDATCGNDQVSDTPTHYEANQSNCPTFPRITTCGNAPNYNGPNGEMFTNYMDYTSASCQNMFSIGQGTRMNAALSSTTSGRNNLWASANLISTGIYNSQGAEDTVTYVCSPKADFIPHTPTYVCAGQSLTITDKSWGGTATSRTWYFPGGTPSTSTTLNPSVTYATPGTYSIRLKVANASGSDSISKSSVVIVMPDTAEYKTDFIESFESTSFTNDWTIVNYEPTSKAFVRTSNASATGSFSCYINSFSNAIDNDVDELISPTFNLTNYANPKLRFMRAFSQPSAAASTDNKLQVYASTNCGKTWAQIGAYTGTALNTTTSTTSNSFTPNASQWDTIVVNGTSFYANNQNVRFKFKFSGSTSNQNLYLDNINLLGAINTNGIEEQLNNKFDFAIIPNPSNGIASMNLDLYQNEQVHIEMFDALGKSITDIANEKMASGFHQIELNQHGQGLTKGVYFIKVSTNKAVQTKKLIVQ